MNVLLIEDHPLVAKSTAELVVSVVPQADVTICLNGTSARTELANRPSRSWHRILLDLDVPDVKGLALASVIEDRRLAPKTVVITGTSNARHPLELQNMKFLGYLPKTLSFADFTKALTQLLLEDNPIFLDDGAACRSTTRITKRQAQILEAVSRGLSAKEAAAELRISERLVRVQSDILAQALGASDSKEMLRKAADMGLLAH